MAMIGHLAYVIWYCLCMLGVILELNCLIMLKSPMWGRWLFAGYRTWFWLLPVFLYGLACSIVIDMVSAYNKHYFLHIFQSDLSVDLLPINNWICFWNSVWVTMALCTIYIVLVLELRQRSNKAEPLRAVSKRQGRVLLLTFLRSLFIFIPSLLYALAGFVPVSSALTKFATFALQLCLGK